MQLWALGLAMGRKGIYIFLLPLSLLLYVFQKCIWFLYRRWSFKYIYVLLFANGPYPMETRVLVQTLETPTEATGSTSEGTNPICSTFASRRPPEPPPDLRFFHTPPPSVWCRAICRPPSPSVWSRSKSIEAWFLGTYVRTSPRYARVAAARG